MTTATPARQPLWVYKREPAGMGEWCYRIYRNNHYILYAESESIAMIVCNGLNRDEQATHTSPPAPRPPCEECMYQARIDKAAKAEREQVLDIIRAFDGCCCPHEMCHSGEGHDGLNCGECVLKFIEESLRAQQQQRRSRGMTAKRNYDGNSEACLDCKRFFDGKAPCETCTYRLCEEQEHPSTKGGEPR